MTKNKTSFKILSINLVKGPSKKTEGPFYLLYKGIN